MISERRALAEEQWRKKFEDAGFCDRFEFVCREWESDHGRRAKIKCRECGAEFSTWGLDEIRKGRQARLLCPECGNSSDGNNMFCRSGAARRAAELYTEGLDQKEIADLLDCSVWDVGSACRKYGVVDPERKHKGISRGQRVANMNRQKACHDRLQKDLSERGLTLLDEWHGPSRHYRILNTKTNTVFEVSGYRLRPKENRTSHHNRAVRLKVSRIERGITIEKILSRDGDHCYICGKLMRFEDKRWHNFGPDYPTIDHVIPLSRGGTHSFDNVKACCALCNLKKGAKTVQEVNVSV